MIPVTYLKNIDKYMEANYDAWYTPKEWVELRENLEDKKNTQREWMRKALEEIRERVDKGVQEEWQRLQEKKQKKQQKAKKNHSHHSQNSHHSVSSNSNKQTEFQTVSKNKQNRYQRDRQGQGQGEQHVSRERQDNANDRRPYPNEKQNNDRRPYPNEKQNNDRRPYPNEKQNNDRRPYPNKTTGDKQNNDTTEKNKPYNSLLLEKKSPSDQHVKTKMCKSVLQNKSCTYRVCHFAHTLSELTPYDCMFDTNCRNGNSCPYLHSTETLQKYVQRVSAV